MREKLANLCHEQWSGWMKYLFGKGKFDNSNGSWIMPKWAVTRWSEQMYTPYRELSDVEKNSDRAEADKFIALLGEVSPSTSNNTAISAIALLKSGREHASFITGNQWWFDWVNKVDAVLAQQRQ